MLKSHNWPWLNIEYTLTNVLFYPSLDFSFHPAESFQSQSHGSDDCIWIVFFVSFKSNRTFCGVVSFTFLIYAPFYFKAILAWAVFHFHLLPDCLGVSWGFFFQGLGAPGLKLLFCWLIVDVFHIKVRQAPHLSCLLQRPVTTAAWPKH